VLLAGAVLQLAHPAWLPAALGGSRAFASDAAVAPGRFRVGAYQVEISGSSARAFRAGALSLRLAHAGRPLNGARIRATFTMLDMDMPGVSTSFSGRGSGRYSASAPALGMAGRWGLRIDIRPPRGRRFGVNVVDEVGT
jgi:hypothetical protein